MDIKSQALTLIRQSKILSEKEKIEWIDEVIPLAQDSELLQLSEYLRKGEELHQQELTAKISKLKELMKEFHLLETKKKEEKNQAEEDEELKSIEEQISNL